MIPFWLLLKAVGLFRVPANEETVGLDESYHGGTAYPGHGADDFLDKSASRHGKDNGDMNGGATGTEQTVCCKENMSLIMGLRCGWFNLTIRLFPCSTCHLYLSVCLLVERSCSE
jgi:hypothetical protein